MIPWKIGRLASEAGLELLRGDPEIDVTSIATDSRDALPGSLFVALRGEVADGHDYIEAAAKAGSIAALVSAPERVPAGVAVLRAGDTLAAMLNIASAYRDKFAVPLTAVTGSAGKTTTKEMIYSVYSERFKTLKSKRNLNTDAGLVRTITELDGTFDAAVVEFGMRGFGQIARLSASAKPQIGIITNIGDSHSELLGGRENILEAKLEILRGMPRGSTLILNGGDALLMSAAKRVPDVIKLITFVKSDDIGSGPDNEVSYKILETGVKGVRLAFSHGGETAECLLPVHGAHNAANAAAAFAAGRAMGLDGGEIAQGLEKFSGADMRGEVIRRGGVTLIRDCYNASPDSMKAAIELMMSLPGRRRIAALGDMLELGSRSDAAHLEVGAMLAKAGADLLWCTGESARLYAEGALTAGMPADRIKYYVLKEDIIKDMMKYINKDDIILVKGSRGIKMEDVADGVAACLEGR